tara:strand:- start:984 stop:2099 length:1116 start_codon:yes stop_codon:yes gene_type:complete
MGCNNDKIRSFLTKPNSRMKKKFDDIQDAEKERESSFAGVTVFEARVIGVPRDIGATIVTDSGTDNAQYVSTVQVRVFEVDNMLPDPTELQTAKSAADVINMHSNALVPSSLTGLAAGDIVTIEFLEPYIQNNKQTPRIRGKVRSDSAYGEKIKSNFDDSASGMESFFQNGTPTTVGDTTGFQPKKRNYTPGNIIITNGLIPTDKLHFVKANGKNVVSKGTVVNTPAGIPIIEYYSTDTQGGLAFIKGAPGTNYANKLIELATAYQVKFNKPLVITSAYRSFDKQKELYNNPGPGWAAKPGTSNHGWGLAFDFNHGAAGKPLFTDAEYIWMDTHAVTYKFYNAGKHFSNAEPWHFEVINTEKNNLYGSDIN